MSRLKVPVSPEDHIRGAGDAPLTLVEYGDFQCPFCAQAHLQLQRLEDELVDELRLVFRHFPLTQAHEYALLGSIAAESAGRQGKFWEMHDMIYEEQPVLSAQGVVEFAQSLELEMRSFQEGLFSKELSDRVQRDFMGGVRSGVNGTPSFFLNGVKYEGPLDADLFRQRIKAA